MSGSYIPEKSKTHLIFCSNQLWDMLFFSPYLLLWCCQISVGDRDVIVINKSLVVKDNLSWEKEKQRKPALLKESSVSSSRSLFICVPGCIWVLSLILKIMQLVSQRGIHVIQTLACQLLPNSVAAISVSATVYTSRFKTTASVTGTMLKETPVYKTFALCMWGTIEADVRLSSLSVPSLLNTACEYWV